MKKILIFIAILFTLFVVSACDKEEFTVSFDSNGGSEVASITVEYDQTFDAPVDPTKLGHTFAGWYLNDKPYDFSFTVRENITLIAMWTVNEYKLTLNANGGYLDEANNQTKTYLVKYNEDIPSVPTPERDGYNFEGWYTDSNFANAFNITKMPANDINLYAKWTNGECSVSLLVDDILDEEHSFKVEVGQEIGTIDFVPEKVGYTFTGWAYTDAEGNEQLITSTYKVDSSIELRAKWVANEYTITFETNGGSTVEAITLNYLSNLSRPQNPTKLGYEFAGWYFDSNLTDLVKEFPNKMPAENLTLYSSWTPISYAINFDANGGVGVTYSQSFEYDQAVALMDNTFTNEGYSFGSWNTKADGSGTTYTDKQIVSNLASEEDSKITLYAQWTINKYTVSFDSNGGSSVVSITQDYKSTIIAPENPTKDGYQFDGWYKDSGLTTKYFPTNMPSSNITLYAKWKANSYTITFVVNGGSNISPITSEYLSKIAKPENPTKEGFEFVNWYSDAEYTEEYLFDTMPLGGVTLYAKWVEKEYTLTIDFNNGSDLLKYSVKFGSNLAQFKPSEEPLKPNTQFSGWVTSNGEFIFKTSTMPAYNLIVTASFDDEIVITFEGVTILVGVEGEIINLPENPLKDGYTFDGWYLDKSFEEEFNLTVFPNEKLTVYPKWNAIEYTISFNSNGGSSVSDLVALFDTLITEPANPLKDGYKFGGWYTDDTLLRPFEFEKMPLGGAELYAKWVENEYTISFDTNGGSSVEDIVALYNSNIAMPDNPIKAGYDFVGWYSDSNLTNEFTFEKMPLNGATLYAKWEKSTYTISFDANGGNGSAESFEVVFTDKYLLPKNQFIREGYTLVGWGLNSSTKAYDLDKELSIFDSHNEILGNSEIVLYAIWEINQYNVTFSFADAANQIISVKHGTNLSTLDNLPSAERVGYTLKWICNGVEVVLSDIIVKSDLSINATYTINYYNIQYVIDGKVTHVLSNVQYGSSISFNGYVTKLKDDLALLNEFDQYILYVISTNGSTESVNALHTFLGANQNALLSVNDVVASSVALFMSGGLDVPGLHSIIEGQISYFTGLVNAYELNKLAIGYAPFKNGYIFAGWALSEGSSYVDANGKVYSAGDIIPNVAPASHDGNTVKLVASFKKIDTITSVNATTTEGKTTISWTATDTSFIDLTKNKFSLTYDVFYHNGEELVLLETVNTNSYTFTEYGKYKLAIVAKLTITTLEGVVVKNLVSEVPSTLIEVDVEIEGLEDTFNESGSGDYYRNGTDADGNSVFIFYTQNEYAFKSDANNDGKPDFTFTITDSNGKPVSSNVATTEGHIIKIGNSIGSFYFTNGVNKTESGELRVYNAYAIPYVTQFTLDKSLANYVDNKTSQSQYINPKDTIYTIGRYNADDVLPENDPNGVNSKIYNNLLTYKNNGFSFDLAINTYGGNNIDYISYGDYIKYEFYEVNSDNTINYSAPISHSDMGVYDEEADSWSFTAEEGLYGVVIKISDVYLAPKQIADNIYPAIEFVFKLDNSINVYTHEQFKAVYANMSLGSTNVVDGNIVRGISMHSDIIAQISDNQRYLDANTKNPANNDYADPLNVGKDGSPINIHMDDIYEYSLNENFDSGNVYTRVSKEEIKEIYNINGNFFTINGQTLPSASINSIGNLSSINGYKIADVQISILLYLVGGDGADTGLGHLYVNDLQIIGNTSKPVFDSSNSSSSLDVMNRNSGGYIGVSVTNGNTLTLNNTIISNANLGVRANHGVMPNGTNPGTVVNINDTIVRSCWSNCVYGYYSPSFDIKNSLLKDAGGAAIHLADGDSKVGKPCGAYLQLDEKTVIDNYVAGTEGYFKANNMELVAMQLKAQINNKLDAKNNVVTDSITATLNTYFGDSVSSYTILKEVIDETTHQSSEKFNFQFLFVTCGNNSDATMTEYAQANLIDLRVPYKSFAHSNPTLSYIGFNQAFTSQFNAGYSVDYFDQAYDATAIPQVGMHIPYALAGLMINEAYSGEGSEGLFAFAENIPGQGRCLAGVGVNQK